MRYLSVCSGIEAASVAWHVLGWTPIAFAETELFPRAVLAHHYPAVPNWGDMNAWRKWPDAAIDVLVGGTPCQSFSVAGLRGGMADPRGNLALVYLAIADRYRPEWLVWENVPGVLSSNGGRDFAAFIGGLEQLGYSPAWRVLDAQYVRVDGYERAVPQRRRRVFVVGHLGDWRRAAAVLFERESLQGHPAPRRQAGERIAGTIEASLGRSRGAGTPPSAITQAVANPLTPRTHKGVNTTMDEGQTMIAFTAKDHGGDAQINLSPTLRAGGFTESHANAGVMPAIAFAENSRAELRLCGGDGEVAAQLTTGGGKPGQGQPCIAFDPTAGRDMRAYDDGSVPGLKVGTGLDMGWSPAVAFDWQQGGATSNSLRMWEVAGTVESNRTQAVHSNWAVRRLTPLECERLQGFPDGYTAVPYRGKPAADGPRYKALGNSMAVNCMRWLGRRIEMVAAL